MRLYVSGKITGCPDFFKNFEKGSQEVREMGCVPVNPCEYIPKQEGWTWADYMVADLHLMLDADGVYALQNWEDSKGAKIEIQLAKDLGKPVIFQK